MSLSINGTTSLAFEYASSVTSYISEKGHSFCKRAKDFINRKALSCDFSTTINHAIDQSRKHLPSPRNFLNGISATASYISKKSKEFSKSTKEFIYQKVLPHDTTVLSLIGLAASKFIISSHLNGRDNQYIEGMGLLDDYFVEGTPGILLLVFSAMELITITNNRIEQYYDDRTFQKIQKLTQNPKINQIALCLFCERGADHNGAFKLQLYKEMQENLKVLGSNHELVRKVIRSAEEIITTFQEVRANKGKPISTLVLYGHGEPDNILFGREEFFSLYRTVTGFSNNLSTKNLKTLEEIPQTATLFLMSCDNGKKNGLAHRIAEKYSLRVFASPTEVTSKDIKITALGQKAILESTGRCENAVICYDGKQLFKDKYDAYLRRCKEAQKKNL